MRLATGEHFRVIWQRGPTGEEAPKFFNGHFNM
jgi:hypothetical protein